MEPGPGANYVQTFRDKDGNHLDAGQSYRLHIPPNPPAAAFWSLSRYDTASASMVQNTVNDAARSGYDDFDMNADGSLDFYFGPEATAGPETNWIQTVPGSGFFPMFRCYTPPRRSSTAPGRCRTSSESSGHNSPRLGIRRTRAGAARRDAVLVSRRSQSDLLNQR